MYGNSPCIDMHEIIKLLEVMQALRDPESGCPWDIEQNFSSIAPYTVEEAYEVADAIERNDMSDLKEELGDLLFQVVFHSQLANENKEFSFTDVVAAINKKLVRRHPHVFAGEEIKGKQQLAEAWERHKSEERMNKHSVSTSALDGVTPALPALRWAEKIQKRAAGTGFDWDNLELVFEKLNEELIELRQEIDIVDNDERIADEMGDVLFSCVNLSRHLGVNPEQALRNANRKFISRFQELEKQVEDEGKSVNKCSLDELEQYWQKSKKALDKKI
jgi:ATP diphosphatase